MLICRYSLRLHPASPSTDRYVTADDVIPLKRPLRGVDGKTMDHVRVRAGQNIVVSFKAMNVDRKVWGENAELFRPERCVFPVPCSSVVVFRCGVTKVLQVACACMRGAPRRVERHAHLLRRTQELRRLQARCAPSHSPRNFLLIRRWACSGLGAEADDRDARAGIRVV